MNDYIENKLKKFDENEREFWSPALRKGDIIETIELIRSDYKQSLTDYHNHIVEKIEEYERNLVYEEKPPFTRIDKGNLEALEIMYRKQGLKDVLSLLQDTNPKE